MVESQDALTLLQAWYLAQCDGEWERCFGIQIANIDAPGWRMEIELEGTHLEHCAFETVFVDRSDTDWLRCSVDEKTFHGYCGALNLSEVIGHFLAWSDANMPNED